MAPFEGTTQIFLNKAYEKVLDKLVSSFYIDYEDIDDEDCEQICEALDIRLDHERLDDGLGLDEEDESQFRRNLLSPYARSYVCGMMKIIFDESKKDGVFTEDRLDGLCDRIMVQGLPDAQADVVFEVTKEVFLEDLFDANPVYLKRNDHWYSIHKEGASICVLQQSTGI